MKFHITGIKDRKILIALSKLAKSFDQNIEFIETNDAKKIDIKYWTNHDDITVILSYGTYQINKSTKIETDRNYDLKYLILICFYQLMSKLTSKQLCYGVLNGIRPTKLVHRYIRENLDDDFIVNKLNEKYLVSLDKAKLLVDIVNHERSILPKYEELERQVSVYINVPFCLSKCSYCSFTSYKLDNPYVQQKEYLEKLIIEIENLGSYLKNQDIEITSIYVGGGTPTSLTDDNLKLLLSQIEEHLYHQDVLEYTLECGRPDSLSLSKLIVIKQFSVTRISINPQTFNDNTLQRMNRNHTSKDIINKMKEARAIGFSNINMDLIMGLPNETIEDYKNSIDEVLKLNPESITIHNLAKKRGSTLYNEQIVVDNEEVVQAFDYSYQILLRQGYLPYYLYRQKSISANLDNIGYCKKGYESIYNIIMIEEMQNVVGLGCGASSKFLNHELILNPKDLLSYTKSFRNYLDKKINLLHSCLTDLEEK